MLPIQVLIAFKLLRCHMVKDIRKSNIYIMVVASFRFDDKGDPAIVGGISREDCAVAGFVCMNSGKGWFLKKAIGEFEAGNVWWHEWYPYFGVRL